MACQDLQKDPAIDAFSTNMFLGVEGCDMANYWLDFLAMEWYGVSFILTEGRFILRSSRRKACAFLAYRVHHFLLDGLRDANELSLDHGLETLLVARAAHNRLELACWGEGISCFHENIVDVAVPLDSQPTLVIFDGLRSSIGVIYADNAICVLMTRQDHIILCHLVRVVTPCTWRSVTIVPVLHCRSS